MLRFEIFGIFDQIFQTTNPVLEAIKYPKYDPGFDLFDLWAALQGISARVLGSWVAVNRRTGTRPSKMGRVPSQLPYSV